MIGHLGTPTSTGGGSGYLKLVASTLAMVDGDVSCRWCRLWLRSDHVLDLALFQKPSKLQEIP